MRIGNFLKPQEKFLVLEVTPRGTNGFFLSVDEDRNIIFERTARGIDLKKFFKSSWLPARSFSQKGWESKHFFKSKRRVIVAADPSLATTIPIPLDLSRGYVARTKEEITLAELESLITQAMQKIFHGCRKEASQRLGADDLHTILVGAKANHFRVDGKMVMDPVGFAGKSISLLLELTFTRRELFYDLKRLFNSPEDFFFAEAPQAQLFSLARVRKLPLNLIVADEDGTSLFVLEKAKGGHAVLYREKFQWPFQSLFTKITEALAVSEKTAKELYHTYRKGEMSENARRAFKKVLEPALRDFLEEMEKAKIRGVVYIDMPHLLPFDLPHWHGAAAFEEHPIAEILAKLGFSADCAALYENNKAALRAMLYFLEAYFDKSNSEINQKFRRRLHWLLLPNLRI